MKIKKVSVEPYTLKLSTPFRSANMLLTERKGFLLRLFDEKNNSGTGDCAPLPQFGSESYSAAFSSAMAFNKINIPPLSGLPPEELAGYLDNYVKTPAFKACLEQALLQLITTAMGVGTAEYLERPTRLEIPVNGIIGIHTPEITAEIAAGLCAEGFETIKLKVGRENFAADLAAVSAVREVIGAQRKLRLDANGKWDVDDALHHLKALEPFGIEYIEQPVLLNDDMGRLVQRTAIPVAADESLRSFEEAIHIIDEGLADILILKPMMLGGLMSSLRILDEAEGNGLACVVTTSLDSALGRGVAVELASFLQNEIACGLATGGIFEEDLAEDRYPVRGGKIFAG